MANILIPIADGTEEIEAVTLIDVLRRAHLVVTVASVSNELKIEGAHGITIEADMLITDSYRDDVDMIVLPGGWAGTDAFVASEKLQTMLQDMKKKDRLIGAMCAAPYALHKAGVLSENYTCYPSVQEKIATGNYIDEKAVVEDGNVITSRGPGTAMCFALAIVKKLAGQEKYKALKAGLLADFCN
jgi:4-methyl-5(b-hydroxyethyl)-thiazole monophosphate biosynthesis